MWKKGKGGFIDARLSCLLSCFTQDPEDVYRPFAEMTQEQPEAARALQLTLLRSLFIRVRNNWDAEEIRSNQEREQGLVFITVQTYSRFDGNPLLQCWVWTLWRWTSR